MAEFDFIERIRGKLQAHSPNRRLLVAPGDDAAELKGFAHGMLFAADLLMDGTHFRLAEQGAAAAGRKALAVNLSDVAAMAGTAVAVTVSLALPRQGADSLADEVIEGMLPLARDFDVAIAGGDTNTWDGRLVISVAIVGAPHRKGSLTRSGTRPGDRILVTGALGGSLQGRHLTFKPRLKEAAVLRDRYDLSAMIDLSDGLASDLRHILKESGGRGARLLKAEIPIHADALTGGGKDPLERAMTDGEDFELCFTAPPAEAAKIAREQPFGSLCPIRIIGSVSENPGLLWDDDSEITWRGFVHDFA